MGARERLGLDVARFDADRRSDAVVARVKAQFRAGVRAGVVTTPTAFLDGRIYPGRRARVGLEVVALDHEEVARLAAGEERDAGS